MRHFYHQDQQTIMSLLNTIITETRNAFGFPQLTETEIPQQEPRKPMQHDYTVRHSEGFEDYSDYLGVGV